MSTRRHVAMALCAGMWALVGAVHADVRPSPLPVGWHSVSLESFTPAPEERVQGRYEVLAQWNALPPEQRQQMRQQMREHWQQMPPEQRQERRQEFRERWQQMPSEERQRIREEMRERGGWEGRSRGEGGRR